MTLIGHIYICSAQKLPILSQTMNSYTSLFLFSDFWPLVLSSQVGKVRPWGQIQPSRFYMAFSEQLVHFEMVGWNSSRYMKFIPNSISVSISEVLPDSRHVHLICVCIYIYIVIVCGYYISRGAELEQRSCHLRL